MIHIGDITKINGAEIEPVDVIVGGSPCQDLSVAGKRLGLAGKRSGLYMEQIRIVKEMRERERRNGRTGILVRPRYMLWENVPGAFSSNKGRDFAAVIEEAIRIAESEAPDVPVPEKGWPKSGCLYSELGEWSLAWRVLDAQFWGVPQRRKRIALIIDFGGMSAPEILFERKGVRGYFAQSEKSREGTAGHVEDCIGATDRTGTCVAYSFDSLESNSMKSKNPHSGCRQVEVAKTLDCFDPSPAKNQGGIAVLQPVINSAGFKSGQGAKARSIGFEEEISPSLAAEAGGNSVPSVRIKCYDARGNGDGHTVSTLTGDHENRITDYTSVMVKKSTVYCLQGNGIDRADTAGCNGKGWREDVCYTLNTIDRPAVSYDAVSALGDKVAGTLMARDYKGIGRHDTIGSAVCIQMATHYIVRRFTPTECERLQGFPDGWTDIGEWIDSKGKLHKYSDTARYKALGNSIALPPWKYILKRISAQYERDATLGSLFDGIGGFPLIWEKINGKGSARWASEIEEFPIAVTKRRLEEGDNG